MAGDGRQALNKKYWIDKKLVHKFLELRIIVLDPFVSTVTTAEECVMAKINFCVV